MEKGRLFSLSAIELLTVSHLTWQPWQWRDFVSAGVARVFPASWDSNSWWFGFAGAEPMGYIIEDDCCSYSFFFNFFLQPYHCYMLLVLAPNKNAGFTSKKNSGFFFWEGKKEKKKTSFFEKDGSWEGEVLWGWEIEQGKRQASRRPKAVMMAAVLSSWSKTISLLIVLPFQSCVCFTSLFSSCSAELSSAGFTGAVVLFRCCPGQSDLLV